MGISSFVAVGVGAAIGAWVRWGLGLLLNAVFPLLPLGTLLANLAGGYLIGIVMGLLAVGSNLSPEVRLLVTTGFLGSLTTFSTFSAESVGLFSRAEYGWAALHLSSHVIGSLVATGLGIITIQWLKS
ncbi:Putative fluoride ion transporter CrcB [Methylophilaceae bacterium]|nr:Putative fluoride ion transporter CrcB [Methylophilaceae bacterium]